MCRERAQCKYTPPYSLLLSSPFLFYQPLTKKSNKSEWKYSHQLHCNLWKRPTSSFKYLPLHNSSIAEITALFPWWLKIIFVLQRDFITIQIASKLQVPTAPPTPALYFKSLHRFLVNFQNRMSHSPWAFSTHLLYSTVSLLPRVLEPLVVYSNSKFANTFFSVFSSFEMMWLLSSSILLLQFCISFDPFVCLYLS